MVVTATLIAGLEDLGVSIVTSLELNSASQQDLVAVLSGVDNAQLAGERRRRGEIGCLAMGPNLAFLPSRAPEVPWDMADVILVPSEWVAKVWSKDTPALQDRLRVWPAGLDTDWWDVADAERESVVVYDKRGDGAAGLVHAALNAQGVRTQSIVYGRYDPVAYRNALHHASCLVWVGGSESQGLAMFEAWSCDIPTLILDDYVSDAFPSLADSAPFLTAERGLRVPSVAAMPDAVFAVRNDSSMSPRASIVGEFGLRARAAAYLEIIDPELGGP